MKVSIRKTEEEIRKDLFGPLKEAVNKQNSIGIDPRTCWCELSEMRLMKLLIDFKPAGVNRYFNLQAIYSRMQCVYDDEMAHSEIYLSEKNRKKFRRQQRELSQHLGPSDGMKRCHYPAKYTCRPSLDEIQKKINELFDMKTIEKNEGVPDGFDVRSDYSFLDRASSEVSMVSQPERSVSVTSTASKRRRFNNSPDS